MTESEDQEKAFEEALAAVSKRYEAKIPGFLTEISEAKTDLKQMLSEGSIDDAFKERFEVLLKKTHTMAGSAGQFGHAELGEQARAVEEMCLSIKETDFDNVDAFKMLFQLTQQLEEYKF